MDARGLQQSEAVRLGDGAGGLVRQDDALLPLLQAQAAEDGPPASALARVLELLVVDVEARLRVPD